MEEKPSQKNYEDFVKEQVDVISESLTKVMLGDFSVVARTTESDKTFGYLCSMINVAINSARNYQNELKELNENLEKEVNQRTESLNRALRLAEVAGDSLDHVIESIPDMIFMKDAEELRFVRFNKAG